ncbi:helix-turn-helix domain-containing protein [Inquilinus sp.]|jgi:excisionase family DNA binding protein|uniref:helix-turn-helix domain-containing protein n=1 Tax=Inquilinus sp. TaxID=1932117 RepID=UPI003782F559
MIEFKIRTKDGPRPALLSVNQFIFETQLGRTTVYRMIRDGRLASVRIGGQRRIPNYELARLVREGA